MHNLYSKLAKPIFEYLSGVKLPHDQEIPEVFVIRLIFFKKLAEKYPSNKFLASIVGRKPIRIDKTSGPDIWSMKHDDLLRYYYRGMVERSGGIQEHAAEKMGVNYRTFRSRCKKLGMDLSRKGNN